MCGENGKRERERKREEEEVESEKREREMNEALSDDAIDFEKGKKNEIKNRCSNGESMIAQVRLEKHPLRVFSW